MPSPTDANPRTSDIDFLFEALNYATTPLTINVAQFAIAKAVKSNTIAKRISTIAKRYNLNITSTTKGDVAGNTPVTPIKPKAGSGETKTSTSRKRKGQDEGEVNGNGNKSDEAESGAKKQKVGKRDVGAGEEEGKGELNIDAGGDDAADEELA